MHQAQPPRPRPHRHRTVQLQALAHTSQFQATQARRARPLMHLLLRRPCHSVGARGIVEARPRAEEAAAGTRTPPVTPATCETWPTDRAAAAARADTSRAVVRTRPRPHTTSASSDCAPRSTGTAAAWLRLRWRTAARWTRPSWLYVIVHCCCKRTARTPRPRERAKPGVCECPPRLRLAAPVSLALGGRSLIALSVRTTKWEWLTRVRLRTVHIPAARTATGKTRSKLARAQLARLQADPDGLRCRAKWTCRTWKRARIWLSQAAAIAQGKPTQRHFCMTRARACPERLLTERSKHVLRHPTWSCTSRTRTHNKTRLRSRSRISSDTITTSSKVCNRMWMVIEF